MPLIYLTHSPEETFALGERLAQTLELGSSVLLFGNLGAGKTCFTQGLAKGLGVKDQIKSPTYAYVRKYERPEANNSSFYHYDLYRLEPGEEVASIGLEDSLADSSSIHAIEWADRLNAPLPLPSIQIQFAVHLGIHQLTMRFAEAQIPSPAEVDVFYKHWATPLHVRKHMAQVAKVAMHIAQAYAEVRQILNADLLYAGAILHDVARVCDFRTLDRNQFSEEITGEKWARWVALRHQFQSQKHPALARDFLKERGFGRTGDLVYSHGSQVIVEEPYLLNSLEAKILYYADKRVKHDQIVDLAERFRDGRERYGEGDLSNRELFEEVERRTFKLEEELFQPLKIKPEDIQS